MAGARCTGRGRPLDWEWMGTTGNGVIGRLLMLTAPRLDSHIRLLQQLEQLVGTQQTPSRHPAAPSRAPFAAAGASPGPRPQSSPEAAQPGKPPARDWPCTPTGAPDALDGPLRRCGLRRNWVEDRPPAAEGLQKKTKKLPHR
ncbi:hypothetical protein N431DRAFT_460123 [Stipitochalara longipes BDJ]|nr:hypothetical protein N431DRAFT_460123 [Stipitochalara longipes BDJ]